MRSSGVVSDRNVLLHRAWVRSEEFGLLASVCSPLVRRESPSSHSCWSLPIVGVWKLNFDAYWVDSPSCGGIGWLVCDSVGSPILVGCEKSVIKVNHHGLA